MCTGGQLDDKGLVNLQEDSYMQAGGEGEDMDAEEEEAGCETERSEGGGLEGAHASAHLKVAAHNVQGMPGEAAIRAHEEEVVVRAHVAEAATNKAGASFEDSGSPATLEDSGAGGNSGDEEAQVQVSLDLDFALPEVCIYLSFLLGTIKSIARTHTLTHSHACASAR